MQRRSFLKSMAAAFATATTGLTVAPQERQSAKINYDLFTEGFKGFKYDLNEPFVLDDTLFATDSKMIISHAADFGSKTDLSKRYPNLKTIPFDRFEEGGWMSFPDRPVLTEYNIRDLIDSQCMTCFGIGRVGEVRRCPNNAPDVYGDGCDIMGCELCGGDCWIGGVKCSDCKNGWVHNPSAEQLCGAKFCPMMTSKLRLLGTTEVRLFDYETSQIRWHQPAVVLGFRFNAGQHGEGRGLLMPLYE